MDYDWPHSHVFSANSGACIECGWKPTLLRVRGPSDHEIGACFGPGLCADCDKDPEGYHRKRLERLSRAIEGYSDEEIAAALEQRRLRPQEG